MAEEIKNETAIPKEAEKVAEVNPKVEPEKKKKGPLFWIIIILVILLVLGLCCCCGSGSIFSFIFESDAFIEGYCGELLEQGILYEDPFGWCEGYSPYSY